MSQTVLIVDDEEDIRLLLRLTLEAGGYEIVGESANGAEAVSDAFRLHPDVITMDHRMPYLTGRDVIEHIEGIRPAPTVIVVSAMLDEWPPWAEHYLPKSSIPRLPDLLDGLFADDLEDPPTS